MVKRSPQDSGETRAPQESEPDKPEPNKIWASTPLDFSGKGLTPYGGLLPVATMLEKLGFQQLIEEILTVGRVPRVMTIYQFLSGMVLALYVGFFRLNHLRFVAHDAMLTGILKGDGTAAAVHLLAFSGVVASGGGAATTGGAAADARTGMGGGQREAEFHHVGHRHDRAHALWPTDGWTEKLQPEEQGQEKLSADSYLSGGNPRIHLGRVAQRRSTDGSADCAPSGECIRRSAAMRGKDLRPGGRWLLLLGGGPSLLVARKTSRLLMTLQSARWRPSPRTDADQQCEFWYQPEGWGKACRFIALRYQKKEEPSSEREQYQLFDSSQYLYRVFVTNMKRPIDLLVWFYNQRAGAENLIKEANNDAGLAAHPSGRWATNSVHFQLAMLAYNLNCWLLLFQREETAKVAELKHTTLAIARLRFLFLAAKIWRHAGRVGVSYSDQYAERGLFQRLMDRLRNIVPAKSDFGPVLLTPLRS
jgi:Transposase DDE domain group 1